MDSTDAMQNEIERQQTASRLRHAVATEAYDEVPRLLEEYRGHVERALACHPPDQPAPPELAREAGELMRWALEMMLAARARTRDQLDQAKAALRYRSPAAPVRTLKIDG
ncbi:MAG TPA: hypothetical protein VJN43_11630 [Bryobacteraceae bacterium]|nr:hypothetical protein [Bryobacteraceae bacterium]